MTDTIPATLEDAIDAVIAGMDDDSLTFVRSGDSTPGSQHHFAGMGLRNKWGLWHDSVLAKHFKARFGLGHADDMSGMILAGVWAKVRGEPYDAQEDATHYHKFWARNGRDSLSQALLPARPKPLFTLSDPALPAPNRRTLWDRFAGLFRRRV
jgi:hypothetical protein